MNVREKIARASAKAAFIVAKRSGYSITYEHDGAAAVTLWCMPSPESTNVSTILEVQTEQTEKDFEIPVQENWPPVNGPSANDYINWESKRYRIDDWDVNTVGSVITAHTIRSHGAAV